MRLLLASLLMICAVGLTAQSSAPTEPKTTRYDAVLVTVNGEPVTRLDLLLECGGDETLLRKISDGAVSIDAVESIRRQKLEEIIFRKLVWLDYQQYKAQSPIPSQSVEDAISYTAKMLADGSREGLKAKLRQMGVTMDEIRRRAIQEIAMNMMTYQFCYRQINTTPRELRNYYDKHIDRYSTPTRRDLALILIYQRGRHLEPDTVIRTIAAALRTNPDSFSELAAEYSEAPGAKEGGHMGTYVDSELRVEFLDALRALPHGRMVTDSFTIPGATGFLRVTKEYDRVVRPFREVSDEIRTAIEAPQRRASLKRYLNRLRANAIIRDYTHEEAYESDLVKPIESTHQPARKDINTPPGAVGPGQVLPGVHSL